MEKNVIVNFAERRKFLATLGLQGEIIPTSGHSDDSVTLIIDVGFAFTGDLPHRFMLPDDDQTSRQSWDRNLSAQGQENIPRAWRLTL